MTAKTGNIAIDVFLLDMRGHILSTVGKEEPSFKRMSDISDAVMEVAFIDKCPFCGSDAELTTYSNGCEVECMNCGGRGRLFTVANGLVNEHSEEYAGIVFDEETLRKLEGDDFCDREPKAYHDAMNTLRLLQFSIAAWWAITHWNARVS